MEVRSPEPNIASSEGGAGGGELLPPGNELPLIKNPPATLHDGQKEPVGKSEQQNGMGVGDEVVSGGDQTDRSGELKMTRVASDGSAIQDTPEDPGQATPLNSRLHTPREGDHEVPVTTPNRFVRCLPPFVFTVISCFKGMWYNIRTMTCRRFWGETKGVGFRQRVWRTFEDPNYSTVAYFISLYIMFLIILSSTAFVVETLPDLHRRDFWVWFSIETWCILSFTVEFTLRLLSTPNLWKFVTSILNIIDFVAIAPYYVELVIMIFSGFGSSSGSGGLSVFRVMRLARVFRIFKFSRYIVWLQILVKALRKSLQPLGMLCFFVGIAVIIFSSAIYYAERGSWDSNNRYYINEDDQKSDFQSIPDAFYWCIVTITTVGYGDIVPITSVGKIVASITMLSGVFILALPISIVGTNFSEEYQKCMAEKNSLLKLTKAVQKTNEPTDDEFNVDAKLEEIENEKSERGKANIGKLRTKVVPLGLFAGSAAGLKKAVEMSKLQREVEELVRGTQVELRQKLEAVMKSSRVELARKVNSLMKEHEIRECEKLGKYTNVELVARAMAGLPQELLKERSIEEDEEEAAENKGGGDGNGGDAVRSEGSGAASMGDEQHSDGKKQHDITPPQTPSMSTQYESTVSVPTRRDQESVMSTEHPQDAEGATSENDSGDKSGDNSNAHTPPRSAGTGEEG